MTTIRSEERRVVTCFVQTSDYQDRKSRRVGAKQVTTIVFTIKHLIMYLMLSGSFVFTSTVSTISLCPSFVYLIESPI